MDDFVKESRELSPRERRMLDGDDPHRNAVVAPFLYTTFQRSVEELVEEHSQLFRDRLSERTFAQRIATILERRIREAGLVRYFADVEYNRLRGNSKYLPEDGCICNNSIARLNGHDNITADVILHSRGLFRRRYDNLLAIETKPFDTKADAVVYDRCRVRRMSIENSMNTAQNYRYAVFLVFCATRSNNGHWKYLDQALANPGAAKELQHRENIGYYETFVSGQSVNFQVFQRPNLVE